MSGNDRIFREVVKGWELGPFEGPPILKPPALPGDTYVCRACSEAWRWESSAQPDGGEGLAKRKGVIARWGLKKAWSKTAARWTMTGQRGLPGRTSEQPIAKSTVIKGRGGRSGERAGKAVGLTS